MLTLTKEQKERLAPYESQLRMAYRSDYVVGLSMKAKKEVLWPVFKEVYGTMPGNMACGFCTVEVAKKLGALYFAEAAEPQKSTPVAHETTSEVKPTTPKAKTPQKGQKSTKNKPNKK